MDKKVTLKVVTVQGYTKEEAIRQSGVSLDVKFDATTAWKKDNQPEGVDLNTFASEYIDQKIKGVSGVGFCVTVEAGKADSREKPYKVTNIVTKGTRRFKQVYEGYTGFSDTEEGTLVLSKYDKGEAVQAAKDYVTANKTSVRLRVKKDPVKGEKSAAVIDYAPSLGTQLGTYIIFGYED